MITVFCALYPEARELIRALHLKKESGQRHFQVFSDDEGNVRVVVTGAGAVAASVAVAELSVRYPPGEGDFLVNFGSCGASVCPVGTLFLCGKLGDAATGRTYYPDLLYRHPFSEAELVTVSRPMGREDRSGAEGVLYDMEGAAIYQAGNYYYGPHQMMFVKVVTDHGVSREEPQGACSHGLPMSEERFPQPRQSGPCGEPFQGIMDEAAGALVPFLRQLLSMETGREEEKLRQAVHEEALELGRELHASVTMQAKLEQLLYYWKLCGVDYGSRITAYRRAGRLPARDKREGKRLLEEFKAGLF